ncbi:LytR/AlgR family response regulator transcription factor [Moheibacter sediminis]|uniref:Transcriptional regulator, LytTR family n=1 Tax=Moheibacter sediminis TaxID=1434700 RepID=A0A1W2D1I7_9FLAO|nr:LytTR family DNA-binding domain-containing protein [Moheibacter sediminis]SMC90878.1 transcriptional regulator, LytTR family [Moheibacter sediminis]
MSVLKIQQTYEGIQEKKKLIFISFLAVMLIINVFVDYLFTLLRNSSFYISESLLFSSYWIIYVPVLFLFSKFIKRTEKSELKLTGTIAVIAIHLIIYPALVWLISYLFYDHTFSYWQTFSFAISTYFIKTVIIYGCSLLAFILLNKKTQLSFISTEEEREKQKQNFINSIQISDNNRKLLLAVDEILYFSANSPYINIYHPAKKYLYNGTLKSLEGQLNEGQFVRIHKSCIVNIYKISSIQSRQNGDYDIALLDKTIVRLSRNYTKNFKLKYKLKMKD